MNFIELEYSLLKLEYTISLLPKELIEYFKSTGILANTTPYTTYKNLM